MVRIGIINQTVFNGYPELSEGLRSHDQTKVPLFGIKHLNLKKESKKVSKKISKENEDDKKIIDSIPEKIISTPFAHLHNNTQFSVLQSTSRIGNLVKKAGESNMSAIAITDRGNMMGCFHFIKAIKNYNSSISEDSEKTQIKPIIGCELNVCSNHKDKSNRDDGYQIVFLAKNKNGYRNLSKMCSIGYTEGFYYVPRVDRSIIEQYKSDLIVLSGNMYGEIANKLLNIGESQAEDALMYWKNLFGDDFYLEMMKQIGRASCRERV